MRRRWRSRGQPDHPSTVQLSLTGLALLAFEHGDYRQAALLLTESLTITGEGGLQWGLLNDLWSVAELAQTIEAACVRRPIAWRPRRTPRAHGLAALARQRAEYDQLLAALRASMGEDAFTAAWTAGQAMPRADAIALARDVLANIAASDILATAMTEAADSSGLSPRELDVLRLIVEGKTDREIAVDLFISHHTVSRHVSHILGKLGVESRTAATAYAVRHHLL